MKMGWTPNSSPRMQPYRWQTREKLMRNTQLQHLGAAQWCSSSRSVWRDMAVFMTSIAGSPQTVKFLCWWHNNAGPPNIAQKPAKTLTGHTFVFQSCWLPSWLLRWSCNSPSTCLKDQFETLWMVPAQVIAIRGRPAFPCFTALPILEQQSTDGCLVALLWDHCLEERLNCEAHLLQHQKLCCNPWRCLLRIVWGWHSPVDCILVAGQLLGDQIHDALSIFSSDAQP